MKVKKGKVSIAEPPDNRLLVMIGVVPVAKPAYEKEFAIQDRKRPTK